MVFHRRILVSPACTAKGRDSEMVAPGAVLEVGEAFNKGEDALGRGNLESKSVGVGMCTVSRRQILAEPVTSCVILGKSVALSVP